ncbi:MAG: hypothetical protein C0404_02110 [Verrucomicrobia bacterium]|nr:hypothetical protein [Verrucomicrobiota bacterium]
MLRKMIRTVIVAACSVLALVANAQEKKEIKVGVCLPLSGALAAYGKSTLEGIKMRVEEINQAGGVNGVQLKLLVEDNMGDSNKAIDTYNKLAGSDGVVAVLGPITSTCALSVRRAATKLKVPVIAPTATNDKVTKDHGFMFRACFNDSFQGTVIANFAIKDAKKAATLIDLNSDYSKGLAKSFAEAFVKNGGKMVAEEKYQQKDTDFSTQLRKVKESGAEVLFVPGYVPELPLIIKQTKAVGVPAKLCGADGWDNNETINGSGDNIEGSHIVGAFSVEDARPPVKAFLDAWNKRTNGGRPGTFEALGYDSASLAAEALKSGGTPDAVVKGLFAIKDFEAVSGTITIDKGGDAIKSAVILKIVKEGDKFTTKYVTTIAPK